MQTDTKETLSDGNNKMPLEKKDSPVKRYLGIVLVLLVIATAGYRITVVDYECNKESLANNPQVILFGTWWCPYCSKARNYLTENNISYCEYDIEKSTIGKQRYDETGGNGVPLMIIGDYLIQGFSPEQIDAALILTERNHDEL